MKIYFVTIDPGLGTELEVTPYPLGDFDWMEESELRRFIAQCPWHKIPASTFPETELTEGVWEYLKEMLSLTSITYRKYVDDIQHFIEHIRDEYPEGIPDNDMHILVVGEKPEPPRIQLTLNDRILDDF